MQGIVLQFSEALDAADAQNLNAYTLATVPKNKKQKSKPVPLSGATYNSSAFTVTLLTRKTLALNPPLDLTVKAASLLDAAGPRARRQRLGPAGREFHGRSHQGRRHRYQCEREGANRRTIDPCGRCRAGRGITLGHCQS